MIFIQIYKKYVYISLINNNLTGLKYYEDNDI